MAFWPSNTYSDFPTDLIMICNQFHYFVNERKRLSLTLPNFIQLAFEMGVVW